MTKKNQNEVSPDIATSLKQNQADTQLLPSEYLNDIADRAKVFKLMEEQKEPEDGDPVIEVE